MKYKIVEEENTSYIIIPRLLDLGLKHCFTTKSMDIGSYTNKSLESRLENFRKIYKFLNISPRVLYAGYQIHSNNIEIIDNLSQGVKREIGRSIPDTDGLITDRDGIALVTRFADCTPVILYDPIKKVHGNIHSGWKGTLEEISKNGIAIMRDNYGSNVEDILVIIGPTIGRKDFEVEIDVMVKFKEKFKSYGDIIEKKTEKKYLIDLQKINHIMMIRSGILEENIYTIDLSTYSNNIFHSYRRDREKYGLMGLITCL